jgi:hypothetical protein
MQKRGGVAPELPKTESPLSEQGWFLGNIPLWDKAAEKVVVPTDASMPLSTWRK